MICKKHWLFGGVLGFSLTIHPVHGQIIPDDTANTSIINNCQTACNITGGIIAEDNLFHSFSEFNIDSGESVYFNDSGIANIFSRVTGNNASEIFGTLGVFGGDANLWLLNPNGVIFGAGATLDINGSFVATTADEIRFGDRNSFSTIPNSQENLALLTVNPTALFFNQMGQNHPIEVDSGALLTVPEQQNITLLGAQIDENPGIDITGSFISAPQGSVAIGAIKEGGEIGIDRDLQLFFSEDLEKGDVSLSGGSGIDVSGLGGGNISLQGNNIILIEESKLVANTLGDLHGQSIDITANNLTIADNSLIIASTLGRGNSPQINITAQESVEIIGRDIRAFQEFLLTTLSGGDRSNNVSSSIYTFSLGDGKAGDIKIRSKNIAIQNGAWILASNLSTGQTGDITIKTEENISIDGSGLITGSAMGSTGNGGILTLDSKNLLIQHGAVVSSGTLGQGLGGEINLKVSDSIHLRQSLPNGIVPTGIYTNTVGNSGTAGNLTIDTNHLVVDGGSQLSSASGAVTSQGVVPFGGQGGNITINAESIDIKGSSSDNRFASGIINDTYSNNSAGNISIQTDKLNLQDKGVITASSINHGEGGDLTIVANESIDLSSVGTELLEQFFLNSLSGELNLNNLPGGFLTYTNSGQGGNINISSPHLILDRGVLISTATFGSGNGGHLNIDAQDIEISDSAIISSTLSQGRAGNVNVHTDRFSSVNGVLLTSSVGFNDAGDLKVNASEFVRLNDSENASLSSGIFTGNINGYPGDIEINTKSLDILGGTRIDASTGASLDVIRSRVSKIDSSGEELDLNNRKSLIINADSVNVSGISSNNLFVSSILSTTSSPFPASNIQINSPQLFVNNFGTIAVNSTGTGVAGNLQINSDSIYLNDYSSFNATTFSGKGGNINLNTRDILSVVNNSEINTNSDFIGDGGNIDIDTTFIIASKTSNISANAKSGQGGNINIEAADLFVTLDSQITASSELGIDGQVNIKTFSTNNRNNLVKLPEQIVQASNLIVKSCGAGDLKNGVFSYTGRGGLPPSLLTENQLGDRTLVPDFALSEGSIVNEEFEISDSQSISPHKTTVEATEWQLNSRGRVELITKVNNSIPLAMKDSHCPFSKDRSH